MICVSLFDVPCFSVLPPFYFISNSSSRSRTSVLENVSALYKLAGTRVPEVFTVDPILKV
jgi:hypothetical protein